MALTKQEAMSLQLTTDQVNQILAGMDTTGMSAEEKHAVALVLVQDQKQSSEGFDFRPVRYKIQKDTQRFTDPFGNSHEELSGVMILKQKTRVLFEEGEKQPLCSSLDGRTGLTRPDETGFRETRSCQGCPHNEWGSARDESGKARTGKACKEMRRIYLLQPGALLPIQVSLPPTSIKIFDDYMSARLSNKITDLTHEVVLTLVPSKAGNYDISVIKPKVGRKLKPLEILQHARYQQEFVDRLQAVEVTAEDYTDVEDVTPPPTAKSSTGERDYVDDGKPVPF